MEGRQERAEPLDLAHDLSSLSGEVEAVARGDRSMQQCPLGVLVALSVAELRRLLAHLVWRPPVDPAFTLAWSLWRRRHQATARRTHYQQQRRKLRL
jgi:hypothetical protein